MPFRTIPSEETRYGLITFGADGTERRDDPDGKMSERLLDIARADGITNVFVFSHGWMGDVPSAIDQYDRWIRAFDSSRADRQRAAEVFPGFRPLFIGLHWPSLPWGDEEIAEGSFAPSDAPGPTDLYRLYLDRLGDSSEVRSALVSILEEARHVSADRLSERGRDAFLTLNNALGLSANGPAGAPDADREAFDPDAAFRPADGSFGVGSDVFQGALGLLRLCSYWSMKKRARTIGEGGMHNFIVALQRATDARKTRLHLMGHSFGCIVTSSLLKGPGENAPLDRPIDSVVLAQGALSLWSYASAIPYGNSGPGYFHSTLAQHKINGPLVTTQSRYDTAVGRMYPMASQISRDVAFDVGEFPKFGAVGTFGVQGLSDDLRHDLTMLRADGKYGFLPGQVYNLEGSQFITRGQGASGAHNDIDGPEVAHAIWQAALASVP